MLTQEVIPQFPRTRIWSRRLSELSEGLTSSSLLVEGTLTRMVGLTMEAAGCRAVIGERCLVSASDDHCIEAEVVGFSAEKLFLMPTDNIQGMAPDARVVPTGQVCSAPVGDALLGRVVNAAGRPLDKKGPVQFDAQMPLTGRTLNPLARTPICEPLDVGVRAINALLNIGRGQRMGLFAGSGVGKSVLLGMMTKYTKADVIVVGLVGERSREVAEFIRNNLGEEGLSRAVVVAAPGDNPPLMRLHGALMATSIAEYFRDKGLQVLLLMDSLTRFAQAQREIGLAIGEPPVTRGYPPSVFAKLPHLVERAGKSDKGDGSITAFYTVLAEADDQNDPIVDAARAILDGHVVMSRELADTGHYPAIDIEASVSRVMVDIANPEHRRMAQRFKELYTVYRQNQDLITVGAYHKGSDPRVDEAIEFYPKLLDFLKQDMHEPVSLEESIQGLIATVRSSPS